MSDSKKQAPSLWREVALAFVLLVDAALFAKVVHHYYPIDHWLAWRYLTYLGVSLGFVVACLCGGHAVLRRLFGTGLPFREHVVLAFPTGVFVFQFGIFLLGLAGLLGSVTFVLWPLLLLAVGGSDLFRRSRQFVLRVRRRRLTPLRAHEVLLHAAGALAVGLLYFQILSPDTLGFDARWYHLTLAEHYAADGAIRRFPEAWWLATYPHLASHLYTWAFLLPRSITFDKAELSLHIELATFLGMLAAIPVAVRKLVPRAFRGGTSFVVYFLFPQVFLYDSNLNGGADHVAALFSIPLGLAALRAVREELSSRSCWLFAVMASGIILTKYSAYPVLLAPVLAVAFTAAKMLASPRTRVRALTGPLLAMGAGLLLTTPLWLKNLLWYGDPFYPILRAYFPAHPWLPEGEYTWLAFMHLMQPAKPGWEGVEDALRATALFPFEVHDWWVFHHDVPIFGPLFTLTIPCLPFLRARGRIWVVYAAALSCVFLWFFPCHYERYLRVAVPWMAAGTAAALALVYRAGLVARLSVLPLLVLSVVWGGDVYFFPTHNLANDSPVRVVSNFIATGFTGDKHRYTVNKPYGDMEPYLPKGSRVFLHETALHLGLGAAFVSDAAQAKISHGRLVTPANIYAELRSMGVTHLLWNNEHSDAYDSLGSDIAFFSFARTFGQHSRLFKDHYLAEMPADPPRADFDDRVAYFGCSGVYRRGMYHLGAMNVSVGAPERPAPYGTVDAKDPAAGAAFVVWEKRCSSELPSEAKQHLTLLFRRGETEAFAVNPSR